MSSVGSGLSISEKKRQNKSQCFEALEASKWLWIVFYQLVQVGARSTNSQVKSLSVFGKEDQTEREV